MAIIKTMAKQGTAVGRVSEGANVYSRSTRDGALFVADWKQALVLEGRGFMINVGSFSTPKTGGGVGGTVIESTGPDFAISVPKGTSIMPLRIEISMANPVGATNDDEVDILISVDQDYMPPLGVGGGTAPSATIYNMNTLHSRSSNCIAKSGFTTTMTAPTNDLELAHMTKIFESLSGIGGGWQSLRLLYEPDVPPIINGPATLLGWWGANTTNSGFANVQWLELDSSVISE